MERLYIDKRKSGNKWVYQLPNGIWVSAKIIALSEYKKFLEKEGNNGNGKENSSCKDTGELP